MNTLLSRTLQDEPINEKLIRGIQMNEVLIQALNEFAASPEGQEIIKQAFIRHAAKHTKVDSHPNEATARGFRVYVSDLPDLVRLVGLGHPDPKALIEQSIKSGLPVVV